MVKFYLLKQPYFYSHGFIACAVSYRARGPCTPPLDRCTNRIKLYLVELVDQYARCGVLLLRHAQASQNLGQHPSAVHLWSMRGINRKETSTQSTRQT